MEETGYKNRVLRIDLGTGEMTRWELDPAFVKKYVGGTGIGTKIIYDEVPETVNWNDPENRIVFCAGPLTATYAPGAGLLNIQSKGAMNNMLVSSQMNGNFGARMRLAGFETIIVQGKAAEPTYLFIHDGEAELRSAANLVGKTTWDKERTMKEEAGTDPKKTNAICIGPAAENGVPFAGIMGDYGHSASSNGPGAVMASKNFQGIVAFSENKFAEMHDDELAKEKARAAIQAAFEGRTGGAIHKYGTLSWMPQNWYIGMTTVKNCTTNVWPNGQLYDGKAIREHWEDRKVEACWRCPMGHCASVKVENGPTDGIRGEEPEYEMFMGWTVHIGNDDWKKAVKAHNTNEGLGLDAREAIYIVSFAMECFENGIITLEDTDGMDLSWGNVESGEKLIEQVAYRKGFGALFSDGIKKAAEKLGGKALDCVCYTGRGVAPHIVDGRGWWPLNFNLLFSENCSFGGSPTPNPEVGSLGQIAWTGDPTNYGSNGHYQMIAQILKDMPGTCYFFVMDKWTPMAELMDAVTGWNLTLPGYLEAAERVLNLQRSFNIRCGLTPAHDLGASKRMLEAQVNGPFAGHAWGDVQEKVQAEYYETNGWDLATGKPYPETLKRLGIEYAIKDLWPEETGFDAAVDAPGSYFVKAE
ncbi:MAG: hypothetical protein IJG53_01940 [Eggerthellaceae bacterium]|nr:hypothetical protein [Eggerthellaceae bacterium]MBR3257707.1 hypothetical protein [Eggerthellaceae bacterium]